MLVQVRCMQVSRPRSACAVLTKLVVASEVDPPAPQLPGWDRGSVLCDRPSKESVSVRDVDKDGTEGGHALDAVVEVDPSVRRLGAAGEGYRSQCGCS